MKEYAKRKLFYWERYVKKKEDDQFITKDGETKDIELYEEKENLDYIKQLEDGYVERDFDDNDNMKIMTAGFGKRNEMKSKLKEERRAEFKRCILAQAQKSDEYEVNTQDGNLQVFASKLMLSLNYLSTQPFYKTMQLDKKLQDTAGMLGDIIRFGDRTLEADETLFKASLYTITTMFGYVKKNLEELKVEVRCAFSDAETILSKGGKSKKNKELSKEMSFKDEELKTIDNLVDEAGSIGKYIVRLESRGVDASRKLVKDGENVKWHVLFNSTITSELFEPKSNLSIIYGNISTYTFQEGDQQYYFKKDKSVESPLKLLVKILEYLEIDKYDAWDYFVDDEDMVMELLHKFALLRNYNIEYLDADNKEDKEEAKQKCDKIKEQLADYFKSTNFDVDETYLMDAGRVYGKAANQIFIAINGAKLEEDDNLTIRNFATEHLAFLFGADELIVKSKDAVFHAKDFISDNTYEGFIMESAVGKGIGEIYEKEYLVELKKFKAKEIDVEPQFLLSKKAMEQISMLRFMDALAGQTDRHLNNIIAEHTYNPETHTYVITSITGINNDMAFGEHDDLSALINDKTGEFNYNYCPRALFEAVKTITPELLRQNMANYVEPKYLDAMVKRFERLKIALLAKKAEMDRNRSMNPELSDIFDNVDDYTSVFESPLEVRKKGEN